MAADEVSAELGLAQCHERLLASSSGFMSCTRFAMPLVVPVELDCFDGQILLTVHDRRLCGPLPGHVVALTVTGPGWAVAAVGQLSSADDSALVLHISSLEGWTYPAAVSGHSPVPAAPARDPRAGAARTASAPGPLVDSCQDLLPSLKPQEPA